MIKPKDAKHFLKGAWHKVGADNKVYIHDGSQWLCSSKSVGEYTSEIKRVKHEEESCRYY